jgi:hypothetical protein
MKALRLLLGLALISLSVFGVPEGCLVAASHGAARHTVPCKPETSIPVAP